MKTSKIAAALWLLSAALTLTAGEFGFATHVQRHEYPWAEQTFALLKANGATLIRFDFDWCTIEPRKGEYHFERYERLFSLAEKYGLEVEGIFGSVPPKWASPLEQHPEDFLKHVETFTRHFKGRFQYVDVINEPWVSHFWGNGMTPEVFTKLSIEAYRIIKSIDPAVVVLCGGMPGTPEKYAVKTLQAGLAKGMDVYNIHPYTWNIEPELALPERFRALRAELAKYGAADKPLWITEIGTSTGTNLNTDAFLKAAFAEAKIDPAKNGLAVLRDDDAGSGSLWYYLEPLKKFARTRVVSTAELKTLDLRRYNVLFLPGNMKLHKEAPAAITAFLKKGGTVIALNGFPGYDECTPDGKGSFTTRVVSFKYTDAWHLGASAWWRDRSKNEPRNFELAVTNGSFQLCNHKGQTVPVYRHTFDNLHLTTKGLKKGDTFTPLAFGRCKDYERPIAGVYHFNSDLKGQFIISVTRSNNVFHWQCCSLDTQARRLGRELLLCRGLGVEKTFIYKFRSSERVVTREGHFGVINWDFSPKPALAAFRVLTQMRPEGCSPVKLDHDKLLWRAVWQRPDRKYVTALWRVYGTEKVKLSGKFDKAIDYLGNPVWADPAGYTVSDGITYFVGPAPVSFAR